MKYALYFRRPVIINTDPQRRCYDGCSFSEKTVWSEWKHICSYSQRETAEDSARVFKEINPQRQYKVVEESA